MLKGTGLFWVDENVLNLIVPVAAQLCTKTIEVHVIPFIFVNYISVKLLSKKKDRERIYRLKEP